MVTTAANEGIEREVQSLLSGERLRDPFPVWNRLRDEQPVLHLGGTVVVSKFEDVKAMIADRERYSAKLFLVGTRKDEILDSLSPEVADMWHRSARWEAMMMVRRDGDEHDRLRRIAHRYFTPRMVQGMEVEIARLVDELVTRVAEQEVFDQRLLMQEYAARVMAFVIGTPDLEWTLLIDWVNRIANYQGRPGDDLVRNGCEARFALLDFIQTEIVPRHREAATSNPLVAALMAAESDERLSGEETVAMIMLLLFAGTETTATLLANGMLELMTNRDQWDYLCEDPEARVGGAVEELLRYVTPAQWIPRTTLAPVEIRGVRIETGTTIYAAAAAANRDPDVFDRADDLDLARDGQSGHVAFGHGPRFCLGASLVRTEARTFLKAIASRHPDVRLAVKESEVEWSGNPAFRGVSSLPLALAAPSA